MCTQHVVLYDTAACPMLDFSIWSDETFLLVWAFTVFHSRWLVNLNCLPHWSWSKHISTSTSAMELLIKEWELHGVHMDLCISTNNEDVESCRSGREKTWAGKRPRSTCGARVYFSQFAQKHLLNECNEMQLQCLPFPTLPAVLLWSCTKSLLAHLSYHSNNKAFLIIIHVLYYMQCLWMPGCFYDWQLLWTRNQTLSLSGQNCFKLNTSAK